MGPPSPVEMLFSAWPFLLLMGLIVLVGVIAMIAIQRSKCGYRKVGVGGWDQFHGHVVAGFIDARTTNHPPLGESMDRRFITMYIEYRDNENNLHSYEDRRTRVGAALEKLRSRFFRTTLRYVGNVNLNIAEPTGTRHCAPEPQRGNRVVPRALGQCPAEGASVKVETAEKPPRS